MLDYDAVPFAEHVWLCALKNFLLDYAVCSRLIRACVMVWGKYSGILICHQEASRMGGKFAVLSLHTFCRAALSCFSNTASIDYVCNLELSFLYS